MANTFFQLIFCILFPYTFMMSFGAGFIQDMNNRINQNRKLRGSHKPKFKENTRETLHSFSKEKSKSCSAFVRTEPINEELINEIRNQARKEKKRRLYFNLFWLVLGILLFCAWMIFINRPLPKA